MWEKFYFALRCKLSPSKNIIFSYPIKKLLFLKIIQPFQPWYWITEGWTSLFLISFREHKKQFFMQIQNFLEFICCISWTLTEFSFKQITILVRGLKLKFCWLLLCSGKERRKWEITTVQFLTKGRVAVNFVEVSRHLLHVASDLLRQFPLWLCDVLISALDATTVKNCREVKHLFDLYSGKGVSVESSALNSCFTVLSARILTR